MGVCGLSSFIEKDSNRFLTSSQIKDIYLVVDGNCVACHLYKWGTKRDSCFGGDYGEYYIIVRQFFTTLKDFNITPIVIFDGGYESKKIKTVIHRLHTKLGTLKVMNKHGFTTTKFFPLFMKNVFWDALQSLSIPFYQTEFEADGNIASIARQMGCPVLSYDSDFYIYDVIYIPFSTLELESIHGTSNKSKSGLQCRVYNIQTFLKEYPGLKMEHLPLLATLLGNDFGNNSDLSNFFCQIPLIKSKNLTKGERKILGVLNWLRHQSESSAISKILSYISKRHHSNLLRSIAINKGIYQTSCAIKFENGSLVIDAANSVTLNSKLFLLVSNCLLPSWIVDMYTLYTYFTPLQVEDLHKESAHTIALPIIKIIYRLVSSLQVPVRTEGNVNVTSDNEKEQLAPPDCLKMYVRQGKSIQVMAIDNESPCQLSELEESSRLEQLKYIYDVLGLSTEDSDYVDNLDIDQQLFFICFITWAKSALPNVLHIHALLLSYFACQAKSRTGLCKVGKSTLRADVDVATFSSIFTSYRKTSDAARRQYSTEPVHIFNAFQSLLYHVTVLNNLIGSPLKNCRMSDAFCGTLVYNLYSNFVDNNVKNYLRDLLLPAPVVSESFYAICEDLQRYFPEAKSTSDAKKRRRKRKSKKLNSTILETPNSHDEDSEPGDYDDLNNKFYLLKAY